MSDEKVIIAGGGIGGLTLGLTLHQIGVPFVVLESSREMRPLGVGINIQPNAIRELFDLGLTADLLDTIGVPAQEWALVGLNGREVYAESRGLQAGYHWPQYAAHRGQLHMLLYHTLVERAGTGSVLLGSRVEGYAKPADGGVRVHVRNSDGSTDEISGRLLIAADGIHSVVRAQTHPDQAPIHWGGAVMWRGTIRARPLRTQSSFVGLGTHQHRMVIYPISKTDADGTALINWIAEVTRDNSEGWPDDSWFTEVPIDSFAHHFEEFRYDWLDVPVHAAAGRLRLHEPDDRPRSGADLGGWAGGPDGGCRSRHVSHRIERCQSGDCRCPGHRRCHAGTRRDACRPNVL